MDHPDIRLEIEMRYDSELGCYIPHTAGLADDSPHRGRIAFEECVEAITFLTDFLSSHNLLDVEDHPDDMDKVSAGTEQLLLEALYQVHGRWHAPDSDDTDDVEDLEEP